jgi:hypothetical protein
MLDTLVGIMVVVMVFSKVTESLAQIIQKEILLNLHVKRLRQFL